jgi:hypothetical protein
VLLLNALVFMAFSFCFLTADFTDFTDGHLLGFEAGFHG